MIMSRLFKKNREFEKICKLKQPELKAYLVNRLNMKQGDGWAYRKGTFPVLLTAHMDTVHKNPVSHISYKYENGKTIVTSPEGIGGDDRCGIYQILQILNQVDCSVLFCEDEEIGSIGAKKFVQTELCKSLKGKFKYIIELDRKGSKDAVYYECDNSRFQEFVEKEFFKLSYGSWSDICILSPALDIASVNISGGCYNCHTTKEYVVLEEMNKATAEVIRLLKRTDINAEPFKYEKRKYTYVNSLYNNYFDYYDTYSNKQDTQRFLEVIINGKNEEEDYIDAIGASEEECWMNLFFDNPTLCYNDILDYYIW